MRSWKELERIAVPQYPLRAYGHVSIIKKATKEHPEVIIAGYASPQVVDRERHIITKEALARDLPRFMANPKYRNVQLLHSNVQIGEVIPSWTDPKTGKRYETKVDDVGLFVVVKLRNDPHRPPIVDQVIEDIKSGKLTSFSISADAPFESRRYECANGTCFWVIDKVVLYEVTICANPVNPDARFTVLSKSLDGGSELAASAFCRDGTCPISLAQEGVDEFDEGLEVESAEHYHDVGGDVERIAEIVRENLRRDPRYYSKRLAAEGGEEESLEPADPEKVFGPRGKINAAMRRPSVITGESGHREPVTSEPLRSPKLSRPRMVAGIVKDLSELLERSVRQLKPADQGPYFVLNALAEKGGWLQWNQEKLDYSVGPFMVREVLRGLSREARAVGNGGLVNDLSVMSSRLSRAAPVDDRTAVSIAGDIIRRASVLGVRFDSSLVKGADGAAEVASRVSDSLGRAALSSRARLDPTVMTAIDALLEDAGALLDGLEMRGYVRVGEGVDEELIKDLQADDVVERVEKTDALLETLNREDYQPGGDEGDYVISWVPPSHQAREIAMPGGVRPEDVRLEILRVPLSAPHRVVLDAVREVAGATPRLRGSLSALGRFGDLAGGGPPVSILADVLGLPELRRSLIAALRERGVAVADGQFIPMIELGAAVPEGWNRPGPMDITIDALTVHHPRGKDSVPLSGKPDDRGAAELARLLSRSWDHALLASGYRLAVVVGDGDERRVLEID